MKLIKFGANWCKPCKRLQTVLDGMELPHPLEAIDIDLSPEMAGEYGVRGVPTLILVDDEGTEQKRSVGLKTQQELREWLDE